MKKKKKKKAKRMAESSTGQNTNVNVNVEVTPSDGGSFPMASPMLNAADMDLIRLRNRV